MPPLLRFVDRPFIMPIVDKYKDMGTVVLGKVEAGEARKGQTLLVLPNKVSSSFHPSSFRLCNISIIFIILNYSPTDLDTGGS
jgi:translation elongation factor EF-1alpha